MGYRRFIDEFHKFHDDVTQEMDRQRIRDIETKGHLTMDSFHRAHCSACADPDANCSGGYFCAVAPEICKARHPHWKYERVAVQDNMARAGITTVANNKGNLS